MSSNTEQRMNVWTPTLGSRLAAWTVFSLISILVFAVLYFQLVVLPRDDAVFPPSVGERMNALVLAVLMESCALYFVAKGHESYRWNDAGIAHRLLWREHWLAWEKVTAFNLSPFGTLILRDAQGRRMKLSARLLDRESTLAEMLTARVTHLEEIELRKVDDQVRQVERQGEGRFRRGLGQGSFILRGDSLLYRHRLETRAILLGDVDYLCRHYLRHPTGTVLATRTGISLLIPSQTKDYHLLIGYVRARATNALVVSLDGPEPPAGRELVGYLHGETQLARESNRAAKLSLVLTAITLTLFAMPIALYERSFAPEVVLFALLYSSGLLVILSAIPEGMAFIQSARKFKRLETRLAALEAEERAEGSG